MDHGSSKSPPPPATTLKTSHPAKNSDNVIKSRLFTEPSKETKKEKDQDADDPLNNRLFYLGGKRSPRLRKDPEWMSIRSVETREDPVFTWLLESLWVISGWLDKNIINRKKPE